MPEDEPGDEPDRGISGHAVVARQPQRDHPPDEPDDAVFEDERPATDVGRVQRDAHEGRQCDREHAGGNQGSEGDPDRVGDGRRDQQDTTVSGDKRRPTREVGPILRAVGKPVCRVGEPGGDENERQREGLDGDVDEQCGRECEGGRGARNHEVRVDASDQEAADSRESRPHP